MRNAFLAGALALALSTTAGAADAAVKVLYRVDGIAGTDYMAQALTSSSYAVTTISGDLSGQDLSSYDIVVYANQANYTPNGDIGSLDSYISGGGRLIYTNWTNANPSLGGTYAGSTYPDTIALTGEFSAGLGSSVAITDPGWGTFAQRIIPGSGTVAGTYNDGSAAILIGNDGRTIWNGFLTDSVASSRLYLNQLDYLAGAVSAVPEPATWAMMITGFGLAGSSIRRRRALPLAA